MTKSHQFKRALALSTAALWVVALGATTTAAEAALDPGTGQGESQSAARASARRARPRRRASPRARARGTRRSRPLRREAPARVRTTPPATATRTASRPLKGQGPRGQGPRQGTGPPGQRPPGRRATAGRGQGRQDKGAERQRAEDHYQGAGGDPARNNKRTVKITPHGEVDGIPQNTRARGL